MANYLVTGAAGFIGAAVAKRLLEGGHRVVTIDNLSTGYRENIPKGVEFVEGDCADPTVYEQIPRCRYDAILHIAGQSSGEVSFDDPIYDIRTNAESTLLQLKFAQRNGCDRLVYASTMSVYGVKPEGAISEQEECCPESFYGVGKLASEHYLRIYQQYGIKSTGLRLFNVYGPGQNLQNLRQGMVSIFLAQMINDGHIHVKGSADRFRDFIYIDDVVDVFLNCLASEQSSGRMINVGTGQKTTVGQLVDALVEFDEESISVEYQGSTPGDILGIYADISLLRKLGLKNGFVSFYDGLKRMYTSHKGG